MTEIGKTLIIPDGTTRVTREQFMNHRNLEEVIIPDSVIIIEDNAFTGCSSLKKVKLSSNLRIVGQNIFSNCKELEEIEMPESLQYVGYGMFSYCSNLKRVKLHNEINYIDDFAFYNCRKLSGFELPEGIKSLGVKALCGCNKIKKLVIPESLDSIDFAALALMASLSEILVDEANPTYLADEGVALINKNNGVLVQYAINSHNASYTVGYYPIMIDEIINYSLTYNIGDYAFAGAKYLREINVSSEIESIGPNSFLNCKQLDNLNICYTDYGKVLLCNVHNSRFCKTHIPFKKITIEDGVTTLTNNLSEIFKNAIEIKLPSTLEHINDNVFKKSSKLKELVIPSSIRMILPNTFYPDITLNFQGVTKLKASKFNMLETKTSDDALRKHFDKDNVKIFSMIDGTYYVSIDEYDIVEVSRDELKSLSSSNLVSDNPDIVIDFLYNLLSVNADHNRLLTEVIIDDKLNDLFVKFANDYEYVAEIAKKKHSRAIREIFDSKGIGDEILFNGVLMQNIKKDDLLLLLENMNESLKRFIRFSKCFSEEKRNDVIIAKVFDNISKLTDYCNLLEKHNIKDRFLYNPKFFINLETEEQELIIKHFNANIKRLIKESLVMEEDDYTDSNLKDLLVFANALGVFSGNDKLNQRACNFIIEKLFLERMPNGLENEYRIAGNTIHKVFDTMMPRELDSEFILFFIENYKELIDIERTTSGFISRVYASFRNISECSMANNGSQRHLKVTVGKCKEYFLMELENLKISSDEEMALAELLGKYYALNDEILNKAKFILEEARKAPRNIFTKIEYDDEGNAIYNNSKECDLKDNLENKKLFSYEWLPKQDMDNLILGKYCNCCAHLNGAGAGIMRASMILDCCQNLVIQDSFGRIVAKATLWVNKDKGYAVFNTIEISMTRINLDLYLEDIYEAFMRGAKAFVETYNKNNPCEPILNVSVGQNRNAALECFTNHGQAEITPYETIEYDDYGYQLGDKIVGGYVGDAMEAQVLVLKA